MEKRINWMKMVSRLFLGLLLMGGVAVHTAHSNSEKETGLEVYEGIGGDFTLTNHHGLEMNLKDYRGKVVLLTFGFTHCPDICPATLSRLKRLMKKLAPQADQVQTLFISIDPERDTPDQLKSYLAHFHPTFVGLTGTLARIVKIAQQYGVMFFKQTTESKAGYFFAHSDYVFLADQEGRLRAFYRTDAPLDEMIDDIQWLLAAQ